MSVKLPGQKDYVIKKVTDLIPYADNPRNHDNSLPELVKSIETVGFYQPMIIDQKNRIVCGHGRRKAALQLEMEEVPCIIIQLDDKQYVATMLSDNKITELTKYTSKTLKVCLQIVGSLDTPPIGFSEKEISKLFGHKEPIQIEPDKDIKRKTFQFTIRQHKEITAKVKLFMKEHDLETEAEAIVSMLKSFKGPVKTEKRAGPVKIVA